MRKITLFIASSLDGYIAREDGGVDWLPNEGDFGYKEFYDSVDTVLMGRKTYDQILGFGEYPYRDKKGYVFTRNTKIKKDENVEFVSDIVEFTRGLAISQGNTIWLVGGAEIISIFLDSELIDEIILSIIPIVIGRGIQLFKDIQKEVKLQLLKSINYKGGLVQLHYRLLKDN